MRGPALPRASPHLKGPRASTVWGWALNPSPSGSPHFGAHGAEAALSHPMGISYSPARVREHKAAPCPTPSLLPGTAGSGSPASAESQPCSLPLGMLSVSGLHQLLPRAIPPLSPPPHGGAAHWAARCSPWPLFPLPSREQTRSVSTNRASFITTGHCAPSSSSPGTLGWSIVGLCEARTRNSTLESPCRWMSILPALCSGGVSMAHPCVLQTWTSCCRTCGPSCSSWTGKASAPWLGIRRSRWLSSCRGCRAPRVSVGMQST